MLRSQFDVIKERHGLKYVLEWAKNEGNSVMAKSPPVSVVKNVQSASRGLGDDAQSNLNGFIL